jgi:hypothetical protein
VRGRVAASILALMLWTPLLAACGSSGPSIAAASRPQSTTQSDAPSTIGPQSPSPPASTAPSASAVPTPAAGIKVGSIATVVSDDLRVRSRPEVNDASKKLVPLLQRGQHVFVVKGPVVGSGYRWYEVQPLGRTETRGPFGWVAVADKTGEPWIKGGGFVCPATPKTFNAFLALEPLGWVACFGRKSMTFPARLADPEATCGVDIGWTITPEWLASTCPHPEFLVFDPTTNENYFESVIDPGLDTHAIRPGAETKDWIAVNVTGHFDHKAAPTCKGSSTQASVNVPIARDEIITGCRATFVVTGIKRRT